MRENCSWSGDVENSVSAMLQPMVQACKLLQMKKQTNSDVDEIIDLCRDLHLSQVNSFTIDTSIVKLLTFLYRSYHLVMYYCLRFQLLILVLFIDSEAINNVHIH